MSFYNNPSCYSVVFEEADLTKTKMHAHISFQAFPEILNTVVFSRTGTCTKNERAMLVHNHALMITFIHDYSIWQREIQNSHCTCLTRTTIWQLLWVITTPYLIWALWILHYWICNFISFWTLSTSYKNSQAAYTVQISGSLSFCFSSYML